MRVVAQLARFSEFSLSLPSEAVSIDWPSLLNMSEHWMLHLLAVAPAPSGTQQDPRAATLSMLVTFAFFGVVMYLVMIRPQQKRAKEQAALMKSLKAGDRVLTSSGIVGVVIGVRDKTVSLRSLETKLEVLKSSVVEITARAAEGQEAAAPAGKQS